MLLSRPCVFFLGVAKPQVSGSLSKDAICGVFSRARGFEGIRKQEKKDQRLADKANKKAEAKEKRVEKRQEAKAKRKAGRKRKLLSEEEFTYHETNVTQRML